MRPGDQVVHVSGGHIGTVIVQINDHEIIVKWMISTFTGRITHHVAIHHMSEIKLATTRKEVESA